MGRGRARQGPWAPEGLPPRRAQLSFEMDAPANPPEQEPPRSEAETEVPEREAQAQPSQRQAETQAPQRQAEPEPPPDLWPTAPPEEPLADLGAPELFEEVLVETRVEAVEIGVEIPNGAAEDAPAGGQGWPGRAAEPPPPRREPRIYGVVDLVRAARLSLETRFSDVRVEGEVSGLKRSGPGHLYFCLKDREAQIDCVMFSREASRLRWKVADGQLVRCRGRLTLYEGRGKFQMVVTALEPTGDGALAIAFEALKQKLAAEGLFAPSRKRPLPFLPRRIGVVTSPSGAVIRDIIRVAHRRFPMPLLLAPTPVQGPGVAVSIVAALRAITRVADVDVVILARGGGSLEDLWAFNDEGLARAIAAAPVPVISAVGHETDFTIADFVADVRAPTPSAAAELAVPVADELRAEVALLGRRAARAVQSELRGERLQLERLGTRLGDPRRWLDERRQRLDDLLARGSRCLRAALDGRRAQLRAAETRLLRAHPQRRIADQRAVLARLERRLAAAMAADLADARRPLDSLGAKLASLSPLAVLDRGYGIARRLDGHLITHTADAKPGDAVDVVLADGSLGTRVETVTPKEKKP